MMTYIFAIASLVILVPVVILLPIGISRKGRFMLIGIAFLLANVGLMANMQLPLYQTILIILLLCGLVSLLLEKRIDSISPTTDSEQTDYQFISLEKESLHIENEIVHRESEKLEYAEENKELELFIENEQPFIDMKNEAAAAAEEIHEEDDFLDLEIPKSVEHEAVEEIKRTEQNVEKVETLEDPLDIDEDISFLMNRAISFSTGETNVPLIDQPEDDLENAYMSEIEKILEGKTIEEVYHQETFNDNELDPQVEMEELEEIALVNIVKTAESKYKKQDITDDIEIEELIFEK